MMIIRMGRGEETSLVGLIVSMECSASGAITAELFSKFVARLL